MFFHPSFSLSILLTYTHSFTHSQTHSLNILFVAVGVWFFILEEFYYFYLIINKSEKMLKIVLKIIQHTHPHIQT